MQTLLTSLRTTSRAAHSARYVIGGALVLGSSTLLWNNTYLDERPHAKARGGIHPDAPLIPRQSTVLLRNGSGIQRYDISQAPSNDPCEDQHSEASLPVPSGWWSFFTVLDGHSGAETALWLRENLILAVAGALADKYRVAREKDLELDPKNGDKHPSPPPEAVEETLKKTFVELDDQIVKKSLERVLHSTSASPLTDSVHTLAPAWAGSCALLAFYDSHQRLLHVAVTGDSRAVLGRRIMGPNGDNLYEVHVLSVEQDGHNVAEEYRLNASHPGEVVVKNGRVLGMGPSRAFGDARFKWSRDDQTTLKKRFLGRSTYSDIKTPPYLTAEPEVISIKVQPGDFLIMGSDGLWECLTSEDAVGLTGWWIDVPHQGFSSESKDNVSPEQLPVARDPGNGDGSSVRYKQWNTTKSFTNKDSNAAAHLIRNALGGANQDLLSALLSIPSPRSRTYRDDITATVVFFDNDQM